MVWIFLLKQFIDLLHKYWFETFKVSAAIPYANIDKVVDTQYYGVLKHLLSLIEWINLSIKFYEIWKVNWLLRNLYINAIKFIKFQELIELMDAMYKY